MGSWNPELSWSWFSLVFGMWYRSPTLSISIYFSHTCHLLWNRCGEERLLNWSLRKSEPWFKSTSVIHCQSVADCHQLRTNASGFTSHLFGKMNEIFTMCLSVEPHKKDVSITTQGKANAEYASAWEASQVGPQWLEAFRAPTPVLSWFSCAVYTDSQKLGKCNYQSKLTKFTLDLISELPYFACCLWNTSIMYQ